MYVNQNDKENNKMMIEIIGKNKAVKLMLDKYSKETIKQKSYNLIDYIHIFMLRIKEIFNG
jgi:hypothetical protein